MYMYVYERLFLFYMRADWLRQLRRMIVYNKLSRHLLTRVMSMEENGLPIRFDCTNGGVQSPAYLRTLFMLYQFVNTSFNFSCMNFCTGPFSCQ